MATTDDNKLRSLAAILGVGSLALFGATACENGADDAPEDDAGVEEENGAEDDAGAEDDPADEDDDEL